MVIVDNVRFNGFGMPVFTIPSPSNSGALTGGEFAPYASDYKALTQDATSLFNQVKSIGSADARVQQTMDSFKGSLSEAVRKINANWEWGGLFQRTAAREEGLRQGYEMLIDAYRNFVNDMGQVLSSRQAAVVQGNTSYMPPPAVNVTGGGASGIVGALPGIASSLLNTLGVTTPQVQYTSDGAARTYEKPGLPWWAWTAIAVGGATVLGGGVWALKRRR